jgi:hypothetical protein
MDVPIGYGYNGSMARNRIAGFAQEAPPSPKPAAATMRLVLGVLDAATNAPVPGVRFRVYGRTGAAPVKISVPRIGSVTLPAVGRKLADQVGADGTAEIEVPIFPAGWRVTLSAPGYRFEFFELPAPSAEDRAVGQMARALFMKARPAPTREMPEQPPAPEPKEKAFPWVPVAAVGGALVLLALTGKK